MVYYTSSSHPSSALVMSIHRPLPANPMGHQLVIHPPQSLHPVSVPVLQRVNTEAALLRGERLAYEEAQRVAAEAAKRAELAALRWEAAAYMIQNRQATAAALFLGDTRGGLHRPATHSAVQGTQLPGPRGQAALCLLHVLHLSALSATRFECDSR